MDNMQGDTIQIQYENKSYKCFFVFYNNKFLRIMDTKIRKNLFFVDETIIVKDCCRLVLLEKNNKYMFEKRMRIKIKTGRIRDGRI